MKILISGASGLIGAALVKKLESTGHSVMRLVRGAPLSDPDRVAWQPDKGLIDSTALEGFGAVIHLAGENIAGRRWNKKQKSRIENSRVGDTSLLARALLSVKNHPTVFICASAIGIYGDRKDEELDENSLPGEGFLAEVCKKWEAAAAIVKDRGTRLVNLRTGMVLTSEGGALPKMITPIKFGLGGKLGSGRQYMSWITLEDLVEAVVHILSENKISGPVNMVAPAPVTNAEFTKILARHLGRPAFFTVPAFILRLVAGEMAGPLLLASARVKPAKLMASGFQFRHPDLKIALTHILS